MICKVIDTIEKYNLLSGVKSVAVGVSGGADSMCLIDILTSLKDKYGIIIKAVHLNHNLREDEALRDENHVRNFCNERNIELFVFSEDIAALSKQMKIGEEECGRIFRYRCFEKVGCDAVAVAHSLSDSTETFIYNLLRGSGSKGLGGIPVKRSPNIIRPLIECTREEIETYCDVNNIHYITDSSNLTDDYSRNYIRHNIIPLFENINSNYEKNIYRTSVILRQENDFIEESAKTLIDESKTQEGYLLSFFTKAHVAVRKKALSFLLEERMKKQPQFKHIDSLNSIVEKGYGKYEITTDLYFSVKNGNISFVSKGSSIPYWQSGFSDSKAFSDYGEYKLYSDESSLPVCDRIDYDKIKSELILTARKEGDTFTFSKRKVTKSLKKLFNELKIPSQERGKIAVLRDGENIVWVEGIGVNAPYQANKNTKKYIHILREG